MTSAFPARIFETASRTATPLEAAEELVDELLDQPARAVRLTKELIDPSLSFEKYCERAIEYQWQCINDDEHEEAVAAFSERRAPEYDRDYP